MSNEKILDLAKKLYELATRGVDGERVTAAAMLEKYMKKHNLTLEALRGEVKTCRWFKCAKEYRKFLGQIASSVTGSRSNLSYYTSSMKRGQIGFYLTDAEYLEMSAKYDFYMAAWQREQKVFYSAFIQKNKLYRKETDEERDARDDAEDEPMTPQEKADLYYMFNMMEGMQVLPFRPTLNSGK